MLDVVALGELLIDFTCQSTDSEAYPTMTAHPGGAPANYLAALAKYGAKTALIGKVGDDAFGRMLLGTLKNAGISTDAIIVDGSVFTTLAFVTLDESGNRAFSFARKPGADICLTEADIDYGLIDSCRIFHFGTLSLTDEPARSATFKAVEYAKAAGKLISFDPNLREPLWGNLSDAKKYMEWGLKQADIIKISDNECEFLWNTTPEDSVNKLLNEYEPALVMVTMGASGAILANKNACVRCSSLNVTPIDTTGAGDIFGGSAAAAILRAEKSPAELDRDELLSVIHFATAAAGLSTLCHGGIPSIPAEDEVRKNSASL